jgi:hypothetical protein
MVTKASRTPTGTAIEPYQLAYGAKSSTSPAPAATPSATLRREAVFLSSSTLAALRQHEPLRHEVRSDTRQHAASFKGTRT